MRISDALHFPAQKFPLQDIVSHADIQPRARFAPDDPGLHRKAGCIFAVGNQIPDARVYKSVYANNIAYEMIMNGECGQFSPDVLECLALAREDFFNIVEVIKQYDFLS